MEELFKQEINFAQIILYKNYCNISQKNDLYTPAPSISKAPYNIFDEAEQSIKKMALVSVSAEVMPTIKLYTKDRYHFFHTKNPTNSFVNHAAPNSPTISYETIKLVNAKKVNHGECEYFVSLKDEQIKRHYNNPFAEIKIYRIERWIKKEADKVIIKLYINTRDRGPNKIYFTKRIHSITITFNMQNGNFNTITYQKTGKTQMKHFYANSFASMKQSLLLMYKPNFKMIGSGPIMNQIFEIFDNNAFHVAVKKELNLNNRLCPIGATHDLFIDDLIYWWVPRFGELRKIKLPDNSRRLLTNFYPTERYLKKNKRKLIAAILDRFRIKSDITIKILHKNTDLNILILVEVCRLFGKNYQKYVSNIYQEFFARKQGNNDDLFAKNAILDKENNRNYPKIENTERENIVKIINDYTENLSQYEIGESHNLINMFFDHFRMLKRIREYYPELQLRARTYETFHLEHTELSRIENAIHRGFMIEYIFDEEMIAAIERPITLFQLKDIEFTTIEEKVPIIEETFIPKVLRTSEDYSEEGEYMHHCVSGYINQEKSIIISLRRGVERVTCEFDVKTRRCIQARYFTNKNYPEYFKKPLEELILRVQHFSGKLGSIEKVKKRLKINGKEVQTEEIF